jgi:hypothetical protein
VLQQFKVHLGFGTGVDAMHIELWWHGTEFFSNRVPIAKERRKGQSMLPGAVHQIINVEQH